MEFASSMHELFKEIDLNGDNILQWEEFTKLTVAKARLLNKKYALSGIPEYYDSSYCLDNGAHYRHRHDISHLCHIPKMMAFAMTEDHKNSIWFINARSGKLITTVRTDAVPLAMENIAEKDLLIATCADMTMIVVTLDDPMPSKKFQIQAVWPTAGAQMSLAWIASNQKLYSGSGSKSGLIYAWDIRRNKSGGLQGSTVATLKGHEDIVMCLIGLTKLDNLVSASLDSKIGVWDTYTNTMILKLEGHRKGVFSLSYNPEFRLLVSCGFDHDAFVWSPFVNSLVFRLKGHHASLVGCQCVEGSPEIITADSSGIFKIWDIRNFMCVQTITTLDNSSEHSGSELTCFFHAKNSFPGSRNEVAARIFASSKWLFSYDQMRVVNERTADKFEVIWSAFLEDSLQLIAVSTRNVSIWDVILGSRTICHENICGEDITACCMDGRKRKLFLGDSSGHLRVYNPVNGALLKACHDDEAYQVVQNIAYVNDTKRFIAGYSDGYIRVFDDSRPDECPMLRTFAVSNFSRDLTNISLSQADHTVVSTGSGSSTIKLWNFESGKVDIEVMASHSSENIVKVIFLHPHELFATSDSVGNVVIWGSLDSQWQGNRISGFLNQTPNSAEYETVTRKNAFSSLDGNEELNPPPRVLPSDISATDDASLYSTPVQTQYTLAASKSQAVSDTTEENTQPLAASSSQHLELVAPIVLQESVRECTGGVHKWGPVAPAKSLAWDSERSCLYTGDMVGVLRKWDLSDLISDVGGTAPAAGPGVGAVQSRKVGHVFRKIRRKYRNSKSAMVPFASADTGYVVGVQNKGSYLGIEFSWAVTSHNEGIIRCEWTKYGLVSSCTERLVKMWSADGALIGVLMTGVPSGVRSQNWQIDINVDALVVHEKAVLHAIMERVKRLAARSDLPKIQFAKTETTATMAKLSTSSLRKRIQQSGRILGLSFESDENQSREGHTMNSSSDDVSTSSIRKSPRSAIDEANSANLEDDGSESDKVYTVGQLKRRDRTMRAVIDKYEGSQSALPKLRLQVSETPVDMDAIKGLSASMHIEDSSLGRLRSAKPGKNVKSNKLSSQDNILRTPSLKRISIADSKAEVMRTKCNKFESYKRLERTLSGMSISTDSVGMEESRRGLRSPVLAAEIQRSSSKRSPLFDPTESSNLSTLPEVDLKSTD